MADIKQVKVKKTGEVRNIKDETARTLIASLRTDVDGLSTITHNGTSYETADLLDFLADLYESTVFTE